MLRRTLKYEEGKKRERFEGVGGEGNEAGSRAKRIFRVVCVCSGGETSWERIQNDRRSSEHCRESIHVWCCVCSRTVDYMGTGLLVK